MELNQALNNGTADEILSKVADILRQALDKLPSFNGMAIRRTNLPDKLLTKHMVGSTIPYPAFTSATYDTNDKFIGYRHRLVIHSKSGKKIDWLSSNPSEFEVLFTSPTEFRVKNKIKGDFGKDGFDYLLILEEV